jgi:hypothetical protein
MLTGYSTVERRDSTKGNFKTHQRLYNSKDNLLYYVECIIEKDSKDDWTIVQTKWYTADGIPVEAVDIEEEWAKFLVYYND